MVGRRRRADAGRDTARQHHACVARPWREWPGRGEGGGRALSAALRVITTLASLRLCGNGLCEGGGRTLAEALHVNTTVTELDLEYNDLREEAQSALGQAWGTGERKKSL